MLLQAGGQRGGNIGRFDKGGLAVENAQAGDSIGIFSQHQMEPPGKLLVALHLRHGQQPRFRPQAAIGGVFRKSLQIL